MRTPELKARRHAAAIVSRMLLIVCRSMLEGYHRNKNIAAVLPEMLVVMAIRVNDDRGRKPMSPTCIAKATGLPRENVRRWLTLLVKERVIKKVGDGYTGDDDFLLARLRAAYFLRIVRAISAAARQLDDK